MTERTTTTASEILFERYYKGRPKRIAQLNEQRLRSRIADQIYKLRTERGLTQRELAALAGTSASFICRLESSNYNGSPSMDTLERITSALNGTLNIRLEKPQSSWRKLSILPSARVWEWDYLPETVTAQENVKTVFCAVSV